MSTQASVAVICNCILVLLLFFFFSSRRRHTRFSRDWSSDVCSSDLGTGKEDSEKLSTLLNAHPQLKFICIDVANGYSEHFVAFVKRTRNAHPDKVIIACNVVTGEMVEE